MPQAQFFQLNPQTSLADDLKSGYEAGYNIREGQRKKALNDIYSRHVKPDGSFDSKNFLKEAADAGIGPEMTTAWLGQKTAKSDAAVKEATNAEMLSVLGRKPDVLRDWFNEKKTATSTGTTSAGNKVSDSGVMLAPPSATTGKKSVSEQLDSMIKPAAKEPVVTSALKGVDELTDTQKALSSGNNEGIEAGNGIIGGVSKVIESGANPTGAPIKTELRSGIGYDSVGNPVRIGGENPVQAHMAPAQNTPIAQVAKDQGQLMDLGEGLILGQAPAEQAQNQVPTPVQENAPAGYDVVEEALRREPGQGISAKLGEIATPGTFQSDSVKWEPKDDDDSNEYRQFKTALDSQLKANGLGSASEYLQKIGENTYKQNLYVPNQTAWMTKDGKIDYAAMGAEIAKVKDSEQKARAKAEEAIQKAKDNLMETAQKYGVSTIASISEKREVEKQEAEMQGRRPEGYQFRYVTQAEAAKGRDLLSCYFDIQDGIKRGGFEGAYAAALAKAKADGSVNADAVVGNLVAMGAIPSQKAVYIKSLMNQNGTVQSDMWNQIKSSIGDFASSGIDKAWGDDALANLGKTAKLYGYDVSKGSDKTPPAGKTDAAKAMAKPAKSVADKKTETAAERYQRLKGKK